VIFVDVKKSIALLLFFSLILGNALAQPSVPHQFYGFATINGNVANGATIVAKIDGIEVASTTTITNGNYGIDPNIFYVTDPDSSNEGKIIEFFLSGTSVATYKFKSGELTELNLVLGTAPVCGDGTCSGGETCSTCAADCGACGSATPLRNTGGPSGGGGISPSLTIKIEGECAGQDVTISTLNTYGNPAREASILIRSGNTTIFEEKTNDDGQIIFTFDEAGEYTVFANKQFYTQNSKTITMEDCPGGSPGIGSGSEETVDLCNDVDCDDGNPCTSEYCVAETGHCSYENTVEGVSCSAAGTCKAGVCTEPDEEIVEEGNFVGPAGFFGLALGQAAGAGLIVIAIIGLAAYLIALGKRKNKK